MNDFSINTNNQNGDNSMNFYSEPTPRELSDDLKTQMRSLFNKDNDHIDITSVLGDGEAYSFAQQIKDFLQSDGYKVEGVSQAVFNKPIVGQVIEKPKEKKGPYRIIIGTKQ